MGHTEEINVAPDAIRCQHRWCDGGAQCCEPDGHLGPHMYLCAYSGCPGRTLPASVETHTGCVAELESEQDAVEEEGAIDPQKFADIVVDDDRSLDHQRRLNQALEATLEMSKRLRAGYRALAEPLKQGLPPVDGLATTAQYYVNVVDEMARVQRNLDYTAGSLLKAIKPDYLNHGQYAVLCSGGVYAVIITVNEKGAHIDGIVRHLASR